jgi:hypothetical protein
MLNLNLNGFIIIVNCEYALLFELRLNYENPNKLSSQVQDIRFQDLLTPKENIYYTINNGIFNHFSLHLRAKS